MSDDGGPWSFEPCDSAEALARNGEPAYVVGVITREEVEACRYARALANLQVLSESPANVMLYRESLVLLFDGYDLDGRVLAEIPDVRRFMQALVREWPFVLWFFARGQGNIGLLLSLLCDVEITRESGSSVITAFSDPAAVSTTLENLFKRSNPLLVSYGVTKELLDESARSLVDDLWPGE